MSGKAATAPDLSVVIVTWNGRDLIVPCLRALQERCGELALEVIVVDNASTDDTVARVRDGFPDVTVIANSGNVGFPAANNQGLARARARHLLFLNPDTEVGEGTLETLVALLDRDPTLGMVGCRLMFPDGRVQYEAARRDYRLHHLLAEAFYLQEIFPRHPLFAHHLMGDWDHEDSRDVEAILGAFMMVRTELARRVGGLPEEVFMFHEDLAFCLRVRAAGYRIRYVAEVETLHHGGASLVRRSTPLSVLEGEVRVRLLRERGGPVRAALARPAFAFRSATRLAAALVARVLPGTERLRAVRPKVFDHRLHAFHLLWALAPGLVRARIPRPDTENTPVVLAPRDAPLGGTPG